MDTVASWRHRLRPRNLARGLLHMLPISTRHELYRNMVRVHSQIDPIITFKTAETQTELEAAFRILHDEYVRAGFMTPHPSGLRVTVYHALPSTSTLIAKYGDEVIGTVSIVRDSAFGFPMEKIFDTAPLRKYGARLAEISSLAIRQDFRENRGMIFFPLLKFLYQYCVEYFGVDYKLITVNPRHFEFYQALLFFEQLDNRVVERYDFVNGAPAVGGFLDLRLAYKRFSAYYGRKPAPKNLFNYFTELSFANFKFPDRKFFKLNDPIMTPEFLNYFFRLKTDIFRSLDDRQKLVLRSLYRSEEYREVLPKSDGQNAGLETRKGPRFDVKCQGRIVAGSRIVRITVRDASLTGLQALLEESIRFGGKVRLNVVVADFEIADLEGWPVWSNDECVYGFHIESYCRKWQAFVDHLQADVLRHTSRGPRLHIKSEDVA